MSGGDVALWTAALYLGNLAAILPGLPLSWRIVTWCAVVIIAVAGAPLGWLVAEVCCCWTSCARGLTIAGRHTLRFGRTATTRDVGIRDER